MNKNQLNTGYYLFGGKGDVWSNKAHIAKSGDYSTLCDRPMLSNNWVRIEGVEHAGCPECLAKYNETNSDANIICESEMLPNFTASMY